MKMKSALMLGVFLMCANAYAGSGDVTVSGYVMWGTSRGYLRTDQGASIELGGSGTPYIDFSNDGTSDYDMRIILNGDDSLNIDGGNVGIGTTSPGSKLTLSNNVATDALDTFGEYQILLYDTGTAANSYGIGIRSSTMVFNSNQDYDFDQDGSTVMTITNGKVGIGTNPSSSYRLAIAGSGYASGGIWQDSDSKFKKDIQSISGSLDKVLKLTGVSYYYKTDEYNDKGFPNGKQLGVIAQELEKEIPEAVMTDEEGSKTVNYAEIIPVLIEAIKAQQKSIEDLQNTVTQLQAKSNSK